MGAESCALCGEPLPPRARFCPACGAAASASPGEERKIVTAVFVDLVDSTARGEQLDPEDLRAVLVPYFARVRSELERFGGTVEKFIGDAVLALFGAPLAHGDDPERAVRAALAVRDWAAGQPDLGVRVSVNTGEALVALEARPGEGEKMASGDVLNTAFRIEEAAAAGEVLVGEATFRATAEAIEYENAPPIDAKGKSAPVRVWRALAPRSDVAGILRRRAPLVGRWHEVRLLLDALVRTRRERVPQLITVVGVPGIGKSRLVAELLAAMADIENLVAFRYGRSLPYGDAGAFTPVGDAVKAEAGILKTDAAAAAGAKLRAAVEAAVPADERQWVESHLRPLVGLRGDSGEESFAAWRRFFEGLAQRRPLVLVLEDLHWADAELLDFVDHLLEWSGDVPLLVLCTARPELLDRRPAWGGGKRNATTVALQPLSDEDTTQLVRVLLRQSSLPDEVENELLARVGGNPLYAEEYVRMLDDRPGVAAMPETVQGVIAARIDALAEAQKRALRDAAVVGKTFWAGAVAALGGLGRDEAEGLLNALERKEFVRREPRSSVAGETEYSFRHVLVRDVAYGELPRSPRAAKHRGAAEWVGSLAADREDQAELVALHYLAAVDLSRAAGLDPDFAAEALEAFREAGERALALSSFRGACRFFEAAIGVGGRLPELVFGLGRARFLADGAGEEELREAKELLMAAGDVERAVEAEAALGVAAARHGDPATAFDHAERAVELVRDAPSSHAKAQAFATLAGLLMASGRGDEAVRTGRRAFELAEQLDLADLQAHALTTIGVARAAGGDLGGLDDVERAIAIGAAAGSAEAIRGYSNLSNLLANLGDLRRSAELGLEALRAADRFGKPGVMPFLESERAGALYWEGRWDEAEALAVRLIARSEAGHRHYMESFCRQIRAEIRAARGRVEEALEDARASLDAARAMGDPQNLLPALSLYARVLLEAGLRADAEQSVDELLASWRSSDERLTPSFWMADVAVVLHELGRDADIEPLAAESPLPTRWLDAAAAYGPDPAAAADLYASIGSRPDEAYARLRAPSAADQEQALAFFRSVGADAYVARVGGLLAPG